MNEESGYPELQAMTDRLCRLMLWDTGTAHKFDIIRQTCSGNAAALSIDKGTQLADRLEMLLARTNYLEVRIERLALYGGHVHVCDRGKWLTVTGWAESVMRGDDDDVKP